MNAAFMHCHSIKRRTGHELWVPLSISWQLIVVQAAEELFALAGRDFLFLYIHSSLLNRASLELQ